MPDTRRIDDREINSAIERVAAGILSRHAKTERLFVLGIANGGIEFAKRLKAKIPAASLGTLDISFHRDDIGHHPIPKEFQPTRIDGDVDSAVVILVDDVIFSGRTVKAALDELFDHGRPSKVELAVLVDRGGRKMPFTPDYLGLSIQTTDTEKVVVTLDSASAAKDSIVIRSSS